MNIQQLYDDYGIVYASEGIKQTTSGWISTACPFCSTGHEGYHLGFNLTDEFWNCFI